MKHKTGGGSHDVASINIVFKNNGLLPMLYGQGDEHLATLEKKLHVQASSRGNVLALTGERANIEASKVVLEALYADLEKGGEISSAQVEAAIRMNAGHSHDSHDDNHSLFNANDSLLIKTMKKTIKPYSQTQAKYIQTLQKNELVFSLGPAGTGKTYIAVAMAVSMFISQRVEKIILSRPAVEAGEKLGFLPGDLKEKIDPYLRPLYDALYDMIPTEKLERHLEMGEIEVAPLAFMRGRTFSNSFVILDEAQNTTPTQMKMFLTRMGEKSRMVVTGDLSQTDLPKDVKSGLGDAFRKVEHIEGIGSVHFSDSDVVRHPLAAKIIQAYDEWDKEKETLMPVTVQLKDARWKKALHPYCKTVEKACDAVLGKKLVWQEVVIVLAGDAFIQELNHQYRGKNMPTNVLSFPGEDKVYLGDIVLAFETIAAEAKLQKKNFKAHATHLIIHGILHLLGHDHEEDAAADAMEAKEIKILKKLGISNPYL